VGDGIRQYITLRLPSFKGSSAEDNLPTGLTQEVCGLLGLSRGRFQELFRISQMDEEAKGPIREQRIAGKTAMKIVEMGEAYYRRKGRSGLITTAA
jgi:hypothetical protein